MTLAVNPARSTARNNEERAKSTNTFQAWRLQLERRTAGREVVGVNFRENVKKGRQKGSVQDMAIRIRLETVNRSPYSPIS